MRLHPNQIEEYIKKVGNSYVVHSEKGKVLSKHLTLAEAKKRLREIEYFKHKNGK